MFLKTLTLKGFKSFADPTTLVLEPGVTVVVGPNGSGKSNVVDAIAWVLGAQGPRVVRSSRMDDVIFAGTPGRPALGRAEVSLTIDNSARRLPIDFNEVTITRTLFRTGDSEYAINGVACRLLDVQELLSDSGVGRQQHVIVSQGQLDSILSARPEERRMVIEEAAGVLKYRRRRERAERRLEASESSLQRLEDLVREVRRQIRPLERQAHSARRHAELAAEVHAVRLYLVGREIEALDRRLRRAGEEATSAEDRRRRLLEEAGGLDGAVAELQGSIAGDRPEELDPALARAAQLRERGRGLLARIAERRRSQAELAGALITAGAVERLDEERARLGGELDEAERGAALLAPEWDELAAAEAALALEEARLGELAAAAHPGTAAASGGPAAGEAAPGPPAAPPPRPLVHARSEAAASRERLARARESSARLAERVAAQRRQHDELAASSADSRSALERATNEAAAAAAAAAERSALEQAASQRAAQAEEAWREAAAAEQAASARVEALELALDEARARAGLERLAGAPGLLGTLPDVIEAADGVALALEAAVELALDAVLVRGEREIRQAVERLRGAGGGGAVLPVTSCHPPAGDPGPRPPAGTEALRPLVRSSEAGVSDLLDVLLERVALCRSGFDEACEIALGSPDWTIVTLAGERLSPTGWRVSAGRSGATRAALERAGEQSRAAAEAAARASIARQQAAHSLVEARQAAAAAAREVARLAAEASQHERAVAMASQRLEQLAGEIDSAEHERASCAEALEHAGAELARAEQELARSEESERLAALRREEEASARHALDERGRALLVLRNDLEVSAAALEERRRQLRGRLAELERQVESEREKLALADGRRAASAADDGVLRRLEPIVQASLAELEAHAASLSSERERRAAAAEAVLGRLAGLRRERERAEQELRGLQERIQRLEIEQAEARVRHEAAVASLEAELGASSEEALLAPEPESVPGMALPEHLRALERELRALGPVNPLAAEELTALEERHEFLQAQLEDVRTARRELREVIRGVDAEIVEVFQSAFADVDRHYRQLVSTLFPGGEGRLVLTAPDEPLTTGVEIEARPPGRNVRRLSLLSGGERSLVALAYLFAVFRSRPSPFYVMDEVEAALDEINLRRFLDLVEAFRDEAQLIIVSHQKRTMEVADALYGISMQPGGASRAVSERLPRRDAVPAMELP